MTELKALGKKPPSRIVGRMTEFEGELLAHCAKDKGNKGIMFNFDFTTTNRSFLDYFKSGKQTVRITIEVLE